MVLLGYTGCHFETTNAARCMILTSPALKRSGIATSVEWIWDINQPVHWNVTFLCFYSWVAANTTGCSPSNFKASSPTKLSGLGATLSGDQKRTRWHCDAQVECVDPMLGWPGALWRIWKHPVIWYPMSKFDSAESEYILKWSGSGTFWGKKNCSSCWGLTIQVSIYSTAHNWAKLTCAGLPGVLARLRGNKAMMARSPTARARAQTPALSASAGSLLVRTTSLKWMMVTQQYWPFLAVGITIFLSTLEVVWLWVIWVIQGSSVLFAKEVGPMIRIILPAVLKEPRTWTSIIALWDQHLKTMSKESDINSSTAQNIQLTFGFTNPTRYTSNIIQLNPTFPTPNFQENNNLTGQDRIATLLRRGSSRWIQRRWRCTTGGSCPTLRRQAAAARVGSAVTGIIGARSVKERGVVGWEKLGDGDGRKYMKLLKYVKVKV